MFAFLPPKPVVRPGTYPHIWDRATHQKKLIAAAELVPLLAGDQFDHILARDINTVVEVSEPEQSVELIRQIEGAFRQVHVVDDGTIILVTRIHPFVPGRTPHTHFMVTFIRS